jgi:hypothetical protein
MHLELHGAAAFECVSAADYEGKVVSSKLRVCVGSVGIGVASGREDRAALDSGFYVRSVSTRLSSKEVELTQALLPQRKTLQLVQAVLLCSAVDDGVL